MAKLKVKKTPPKKVPLRVCVDRRVHKPDPQPIMIEAIRREPEFARRVLNSRENALVNEILSNPDRQLNIAEQAFMWRMAILSSTKWEPGQTITIAFLDGSELQKEKTKKYARYWTLKRKGNANIKLKFVKGKDAMIRISFIADKGSWSYTGTECIGIPVNEPTMNFGWLRNRTPESEWERVVVHEFGHALGCIHEHQNPDGGIKWNKAAVYRFYKGSPNYWKKKDVDSNIFEHYGENQTQFTDVDLSSIMTYFIPPEFTKDGFSMPENLRLSPADIHFIQTIYPK